MARAPENAVRIRLTGRGGQGIMLAGAVLAEAAMRDGRHVSQIQEYGPEARLGATRADVIVSAAEIAYPEVDRADVLLGLSRDGALRYLRSLAEDGIAILDDRIDLPEESTRQTARIMRLPLVRTAREIGDEITTNMVGLGALCAVSRAVTPESLEAALRARAKAEFAEANVRALAAGQELGRRAAGEVAQTVP